MKDEEEKAPKGRDSIAQGAAKRSPGLSEPIKPLKPQQGAIPRRCERNLTPLG